MFTDHGSQFPENSRNFRLFFNLKFAQLVTQFHQRLRFHKRCPARP